jgi:hypothetical protein
MAIHRSMQTTILFLGLAFSSAFGQTTPPTNIVVDGQGATPFITLQTNLGVGNKAGVTQHEILGPYATTSGDPGALYIGAGQSPTGGRNDIYLYNLSCGGGTCNVPLIQLDADTTQLGGNLAVGGSDLVVNSPATSAIPRIHLQGNVSIGGKSGITEHQIFGPYNTTQGDPGALYIGAGQSPTGGRNDIILYSLNGGNVPLIALDADTTQLGGSLTFPDGSVQTKAQAVGPQGPAGPQGPQGPQGPPGPPAHTSAICSQNIPSCPDGFVIDPILAPCSVTSDTGSCSATAGRCAVCKP